jgi:peptidoglycan/xylan/chitin deacetylase (PgdA/CDA1 family)
MLPVLLYHKIDFPPRDARVRGGYTPPRRFARQMRYLKKQGFVFYTASELIEYYKERGSLPPRGVALTFDDGWRDNYTNAFPVLRALDIKATIFLVPSLIGQVSSRAQAEGESGRAHLSREEIIEMSQGGIEFGSHSLNHTLLHEISLPEIKSEVEQSKGQIEDIVQRQCKVFAYPAGFFSDDAKRVIADAGHIGAFSTVYGPTDQLDLYALNRLEILRRDRWLFQFMTKLKRLGVAMQ